MSRWVQSVHLNSTALFKLVSPIPDSGHYTVHLYFAVHSTVNLNCTELFKLVSICPDSCKLCLHTLTLLYHLNYNLFTTFARSFYSRFKTFVQILFMISYHNFCSKLMSKALIQKFFLRCYELWTNLSTILINYLYSQLLLTFLFRALVHNCLLLLFCSQSLFISLFTIFYHLFCSQLLTEINYLSWLLFTNLIKNFFSHHFLKLYWTYCWKRLCHNFWVVNKLF